MQDRSRQLDENLLQRTAGPCIRVNRVGLVMPEALPVYAKLRTCRCTALADESALTEGGGLGFHAVIACNGEQRRTVSIDRSR
jgi:hypothetical protein